MGTPAWLQRLESRIALALSRADAGIQAAAAGGNHVDVFNAASVGPADPLIFQAPAFTTRTGHVRITLYFSVNANGGTLAVGDSIGLNIARDGAPIVGPFAAGVIAHANELGPGGKELSLAFEDTVAAGSTHTWGGEMFATAGHTFGAPNAGWLNVLIQDLPA